jgi:hypothetical protein
MTREEILRQIAVLDKQINEISAANRAPRLASARRGFPTGTYITGALFVAYNLFGGVVLPAIHRGYGHYALYLGLFLLLVAILQTFKWIFGRGAGNVGKYMEAMDKTKDLMEQRAALQAKLQQGGK